MSLGSRCFCICACLPSPDAIPQIQGENALLLSLVNFAYLFDLGCCTVMDDNVTTAVKQDLPSFPGTCYQYHSCAAGI